jgi:hypothetical protein
MIQDFNKSETHAWELLLGTPPTPPTKKPITEHDHRCAFHQLTYAVFPSSVSQTLVYLEKLIWFLTLVELIGFKVP